MEFESKPPTYERGTVIAAAHMLKALGHAGLNEFVLEMGLSDGAASGSGLQARVTALAKYAIENPTELSPARRTIPFEIIERASELWRQETQYNLRPEDAGKFEAAMTREGYGGVLRNGRLPVSADDELPRMPSHSQEEGRMSRSAFISQLKQTARLTPEQMTAGIARLQKRIEELEAFDPAKVNEEWPPEVKALSASIDGTLERVFGRDTKDYERYAAAAQLNDTQTFGGERPIATVRDYLQKDKMRGLALLRQAVSFLQEELALTNSVASPSKVTPPKLARKVFIVHGHDNEAKIEVARFLERIGFEAIILHEQASRNRTIIEKIEANKDVGFAVILLTPDDEGNKKGDSPQPRARQNVVLELGYFIGCLGRDRVCALMRGKVELPSDFGGVVYETFDDHGAWKGKLAKELAAAEYEIDWPKVHS